jgi:hypothetical protein
MAPGMASPGKGSGEVFGVWAGIALKAGRLISRLGILPGGSEAVDLLGALVDAQNSQSALLKSIKADTAALRNERYKVALNSMAEALRVGPRDPLWAINIRRAEDNLSHALALVSGPNEQALVEYNLWIVYLAMGSGGSACHHLELSMECAKRAVNGYVLQARSLLHDARPAAEHVRRERSETAQDVVAAANAVALVGTVGLWSLVASAASAPGGRIKSRACRELGEFIGFYNLLQYTVSGIRGDAEPQYLVLEYTWKPGEGLTRKGLQGNFQDWTLRLR